MPAGAVRLFGEQLTPVASPWLLRNLGIDDIQLLNYRPAPAIVAPRAAV